MTSSRWQLLAACRGLPDAVSDRIFFDTNSPRRAKVFCDSCPVFAQCATFADGNRVTHGIFAGEMAGPRRRRLRITEAGDRAGATAA